MSTTLMLDGSLRVCADCGSEDVEVIAWVKINGRVFAGSVGEKKEQFYCPNCESSKRPKSKRVET